MASVAATLPTLMDQSIKLTVVAPTVAGLLILHVVESLPEMTEDESDVFFDGDGDVVGEEVQACCRWKDVKSRLEAGNRMSANPVRLHFNFQPHTKMTSTYICPGGKLVW